MIDTPFEVWCAEVVHLWNTTIFLAPPPERFPDEHADVYLYRVIGTEAINHLYSRSAPATDVLLLYAKPRYEVGTRLLFKGTDIKGTVVENYKFAGDICVDWDNGQQSSYDPEFLNEHTEPA